MKYSTFLETSTKENNTSQYNNLFSNPFSSSSTSSAYLPIWYFPAFWLFAIDRER